MKKQMKLFTNVTKPIVLFVLLFALGVGQMWADMYLAGTMNGWAQTDATKFVDNKIEVTLDADTTYEFKIVDGGKWRSCDASITNTSLNYVLDKENVDGYNISIETGEAGTYIFQYSYYDSKHHLSVYYPQARLKKNTVLYFDGRNSTKGWGTYPWGARFFYKYYDSGGDHSSVDCTSAVEGYVHYTTVPNHDYLGQIQVERKNPSDMDGTRWNYAAVCCAYNRDNSAQNCMAISDDNKGWEDNFTPIWTTYCPPISSVTMADNGSTLYGGDGSAGTPYLIEAGDPIKVHVTEAVSAVNDGNMTVNYQFKDGASNIGDEGTSDEATKTSGSSGTTHTIIVEARNKYNGAEGTLARCTLYYETKTVYTGLNVAKSGDDSKASAPTISQSWAIATNSVTVTATVPDGYRFAGWTSSNGSFADASALSTTFTPTADDAVATANYALRWAISTSYDSWNINDHIIGNISTSDGVTSGYVDITLPANTRYELKLYDKAGVNRWLGHTTDGVTLNYANSGTKYAIDEGYYNLGYTTAGAGSYRFTWDITNSKVSVTYPTSYTVTYDGNGKTSGDVPSVLYYAANATVTVAAAPDSWGKSGYTFGGWNTANDGSGSNYTAGTGTFSITADTTLYAKWTQDISLDRESGTSGSKTVTATYNSATLGSYTNPERLGYTFGGYYSGDDGTGQLIINTSKQLQANKTDGVVYTGASGIWKHDGATTLYAKWTANPYTVTLNNLEADVAGTTSVNVTYDATTGLTSAITKPEKAHYDFGGYYTSNDEGVTLGTQLIDENGNWKKSISGYTGADGNNPTWVYADNLTLYAKWIEHEYTITIAVTGSGSVNVGSSTTAKYVTASGDITANPSTGWSFRDWGFSETGTGNYDVYVSNSTTYHSTDATIRILAQHDGTLTANFIANGYTVSLENEDADEDHKGTETVNVTYSTTTGLTSPITKPEKAHYDFGGYWTSANSGATLDVQLIDENGNWIKGVSGYTGTSGDYATWVYAGNLTLYAKWTEHEYALTINVSPDGAGTVSPAPSVVKYVTPTALLTATPSHDAWIFKEWQYSTNLGPYGETGNDNTVQVTASQDGTLTAVFEPRYTLVGSLSEAGDPAGGMPGWTDPNADAKAFSVNSTTPSLEMTKTCTLNPNSLYKFEVHDRKAGENYGYGDGTSIIDGSQSFNTQDRTVLLQTKGRGEYTFTISAITESGGKYYPTVSVSGPTSHFVTIKWADVDIDGSWWKTSRSTGGTVAAEATEGGSTNPISDGQYVAAGGSITYTATPATGYSFGGWWNTDWSNKFSDTNPYTSSSISTTQNFEAKFDEKYTTVTINTNNSAGGSITVGGSAFTWGNTKTAGVTTKRALVISENTGYNFTGWALSSTPDFELQEKSGDTDKEVTLAGLGGTNGSSGTLTANFTAKTYTVTLNDDHGGSNNGSATATYDATSLSDISDATFSGWTLLGYWNTDGNQVLDASGNIIANVVNYTGPSHEWRYNGDVDLYAHWSRSVTLDDNGDYDRNGSVTVTYNGSAATPTAPERMGYEVEGYYVETGCTNKVMAADGALSNYTDYVENSKWVRKEATTLYTKWNESAFTVTINAGDHGTVSTTSVTDAKPETPSSSFTVTANAGYAFSHWTYSEDNVANTNHVSTSGATKTFTVNAKKNVTITANYVVRYGLYGSLDNTDANNEYGMPGWSASQSFTYSAGTYTTTVDLTKPNNTYKFRVLDRRDNTSWGLSSKAVVLEKTATTLGSTNADAQLATAGTGIYTLSVTEVDAGTHPQITITNPTSYQVNYGASVGGRVTSVVDGDGNPIPSGGYVRSGGSVTFTAAANAYYTFVGWCNNDSYGDTFNTDLSWTNSDVTETQNSFAKFKSTNFVIYRTGDKDDDPRAALDDVESYAGGTISEIIEFRMKVRELDKWYSLSLPFTVNAVKVWDDEDGEYYDIVPYYRATVDGTLQGGHYIIRSPKTATDLSIAEFDDWYDPTSADGYLPSQNTPYIIQWHMSYFNGKYISFFSPTEQTIPESMSVREAPSLDNVVNVYGNNSMRSGSVAGAYLLENDYGSDGAWIRSENVSESRTILPFECYIRANSPTTTKYRILHRDMDINGETGWEDVINSESKAQITVYTMSGFRVTQFNNCSFDQAARQLRKTFNEGLFIFRADNESVKVMLGGK